jgi:hypothetical protein
MTTTKMEIRRVKARTRRLVLEVLLPQQGQAAQPTAWLWQPAVPLCLQLLRQPPVRVGERLAPPPPRSTRP